jgi:hypothetical protein
MIQRNVSTFTVSALGGMSDLTLSTVWAREANPFRGRKRLAPGTYTCTRYRLPQKEAEMISAVEGGREAAYYIINGLEGYVAVRRES